MNLSEKTELVFEFPVEFVAIKNLAVWIDFFRCMEHCPKILSARSLRTTQLFVRFSQWLSDREREEEYIEKNWQRETSEENNFSESLATNQSEFIDSLKPREARFQTARVFLKKTAGCQQLVQRAGWRQATCMVSAIWHTRVEWLRECRRRGARGRAGRWAQNERAPWGRPSSHTPV